MEHIQIDGIEYKLSDRNAEEGEKVLVVEANHTSDKYESGDVFTVESDDYLGIYNEEVATDDQGLNPDGLINHDEYRVLVPTGSRNDAPYPPYSYEELIANLVRRVGQLERKVSNQEVASDTLADRTYANEKDLRTWAEDYSEFKGTTGAELEMLTDDIVTLDERTQPERLTESVEYEQFKRRRCCRW